MKIQVSAFEEQERVGRMALPRHYPCYDNQLQENHCDANFDPLERQLLSQPETRKKNHIKLPTTMKQQGVFLPSPLC